MLRTPMAARTVISSIIPTFVPLALALCVATACRGTDERSTDHSHEEHAAAPETHAAEAPDDLLRIAPEMLRDLRLTTSVVEARPGGEGVTALGEVGVNQERYAEVGAPMTARIGDVLAGVGDTVTFGQPLVVLESVELGKDRKSTRLNSSHLGIS